MPAAKKPTSKTKSAAAKPKARPAPAATAPPKPAPSPPATSTAAPAPKPARKPAEPKHLSIARMLTLFEQNVPHEAESGLYGATARDQWAGRQVATRDGVYMLKGGQWALTIRRKVFVQAVRRDRPEWPARLTTVEPA